MKNWIDVSDQSQVEVHRQVGVGDQLNRVHQVWPPGRIERVSFVKQMVVGSNPLYS